MGPRARLDGLPAGTPPANESGTGTSSTDEPGTSAALPPGLDRAFRGGGEAGAQMRAFDWASSPVGPPDTWPNELCSAVSMLLASRAQIILFWGPDLIAFFNDAYRPTMGAKQGDGLGRPAQELWSEIWDVLGPLLTSVVRNGEAFWAQNHPFFLERHGYREETFFDISYDPIRVGDDVAGVYCIVSETTGRVLGERRLRTLRELGARLSSANDIHHQGLLTAQVLADNPQDVPFALVYLDGTGDGVELVGCAGVDRAAVTAPHSLAQRTPVDSPGSAAYTVLDTVLVDQITGRGRTHDFIQDPPEHAAPDVLVLPISSGNQTVGVVVFGVSRWLNLSGDYRDFFDLVAAQFSSAVTNARAYAQERKRAASLAALDQAKTDFFSNVSHEFRTPLTLILRPLEDVLGDPELPRPYAEPLTMMHRNALRLLQLVNTVLDFAQLEAGRMHAEYAPTDLGAYTGRLAGVFRSAIEQAGLRLDVQCEKLSEPVYVDRAMWEKIILNLLSNAVKYTLAGEIRVSVEAAHDRAVLHVADTGVGISADELPHLFERFHRVRNAQARTQDGTGIGLALVQELVALHGGTVTVVSEPGEGSTFTVCLPFGAGHLPADQVVPQSSMTEGEVLRPFLAGARQWAPAAELVRGEDAVKPVLGEDAGEPVRGEDADSSILVVDDNADLRDYVSRLLSQYWHVVSVRDGVEALAAARRQRFHLVLTDVMMPQMDGFELVRQLRDEPLTRDVPIIVLSARAGAQESGQGLAAGADDYLVKPFSAQELLARVRANLELGQLRGRLVEQLRILTDAAVALVGGQDPDTIAQTAAHCARKLVRAGRVLVSIGGRRFPIGSLEDCTPNPTVLALRDTGTRTLGELAVWTHRTATLTEADRALLGQLAQLVALRLENMRLYEVEHRVATTLQHSLLPQTLPQLAGAYTTYRYLPGSGDADVGGDWYDVIREPDGRLSLMIGDVVGKGVTAAAAMGQLRNALRAYLLEGLGPADLLPRLNRLVNTLDGSRYATMVCLRFDPRTGELEAASAGHPSPLIVDEHGGVRSLYTRALGPPVGALAEPVFRTVTARLAPGSRLVMYTDGLIEDRDSGTDSGMAMLLDEVHAGHGDLEDLLDRLIGRVAARSRRDDVALLGLEVYDPHRLAVQLPCDATKLVGLRRRLQGFLSGHDVPENDVGDMVMAVSEAAANAIEHPVDRGDSTVHVEAAVVDGMVLATVRNQGHWRAAPSWGHRGRGLAIIQSLTDMDVEQGEDGTTVTLRRRIDR